MIANNKITLKLMNSRINLVFLMGYMKNCICFCTRVLVFLLIVLKQKFRLELYKIEMLTRFSA